MPLRDKEKREAYYKAYREKNKEKLTAQKKAWYENNKEKNKEKYVAKSKKNYEKHKDKILVKQRAYSQTPDGRKANKLSNWKIRGLVCEDVDSLYCHYLNATNCDECGVLFGKYGDGSGDFKTMDHSHETGKFRNFLCNRCNLKRGEHNL